MPPFVFFALFAIILSLSGVFSATVAPPISNANSKIGALNATMASLAPSNGPIVYNSTDAPDDPPKYFCPCDNETDGYWPGLCHILDDQGGYYRDDELCAATCQSSCVSEMLRIVVEEGDKKPVYIWFWRCNALRPPAFDNSLRFVAIRVGAGILMGLAAAFAFDFAFHRRRRSKGSKGSKGGSKIGTKTVDNPPPAQQKAASSESEDYIKRLMENI